MERVVERGLARRELEGLKHLSLDEKRFRRGQNYISVLTDPGPDPRVLEVTEGQRTEGTVALIHTFFRARSGMKVWLFVLGKDLRWV